MMPEKSRSTSIEAELMGKLCPDDDDVGVQQCYGSVCALSL